MAEKQYYYLGNSRLSIPWWTEVVKSTHQEGVERVDAPMLFSTLEGVAEELRDLNDDAPDEYLRLVKRHGEETANEAYGNTLPVKMFPLDMEMLLDYLEDSDFLCVMVDGRMTLRQDFAEELRKKLEESSGEPPEDS